MDADGARQDSSAPDAPQASPADGDRGASAPNGSAPATPGRRGTAPSAWLSTVEGTALPVPPRASRRRRLRWWAPRLGAALVPLLLVVVLYVLAVWPQSQAYGRIVTHGPAGSDRKLLALTFDDGPNDPATSALLDVLKEKNVHVTFFVVGENVRAFPDTLRREAAEGHAIGNHSYRHKKRDTLLEFNYGELEETQQAVQEVLGYRPALYRSPNGFHTPWQLRAVRRAGLTTVHWNVQTLDWERPDPDTIVRRVLDHVSPGAIVLLHDGDDTHHGSDRTPTVAAVAKLIDELRARGYELVTVPEMLHIPATLPASQRTAAHASPP